MTSGKPATGAMERAAAGAPAEAPAVTLTPAAVAHLRALIEEQGIPEEERNLRIAVRTGGCSGFSYELGFDRRNADDGAAVIDGMTVLVDAASLPKVRGLSVDFVDTVQEQGFKISNPNAKSSCGCGKSFEA